MTAPVADAKTFTAADFRLRSGLVMPEVSIAYRTLGTLAPSRDNVVLVTHGNTSGPQMIDPGGMTGEGSWNELVGPGKPVDTNRYFAICPNMLGSSYGSTNAASIDPMTGKRYGPRFPDITVGDIVATQRALLDHLGIERLVAIVGPSYGGFQAFQWAVDYPNAMKGIAAVVTTPALTPERSDGNLVHLRATLSRDPNWNGGDYYDRGGVLESMIQIRIPTLKTYGIEARLRDTLSDPAAIEAAIREEAARWAEGFDANSLLILAKALDLSWTTTMSLLFLGAANYRITARDLDTMKNEFARLNVETSKNVLKVYQSRREAADSSSRRLPQLHAS